jgi:hypothetical protein
LKTTVKGFISWLRENGSRALDGILISLADEAKKEGWIMTPVVVIDGRVVHFGYVSTPEIIRSWLLSKP